MGNEFHEVRYLMAGIGKDRVVLSYISMFRPLHIRGRVDHVMVRDEKSRCHLLECIRLLFAKEEGLPLWLLGQEFHYGVNIVAKTILEHLIDLVDDKLERNWLG